MAGPVTVITTVSAELLDVPSLTTKLKVKEVAWVGAVKLGLLAVLEDRLTVVPLV